MKKVLISAGVGFGWYLAYTALTNLVVRPLVQKVANTANLPKIGQVL
jgi:hypothetical protein